MMEFVDAIFNFLAASFIVMLIIGMALFVLGSILEFFGWLGRHESAVCKSVLAVFLGAIVLAVIGNIS